MKESTRGKGNVQLMRNSLEIYRFTVTFDCAESRDRAFICSALLNILRR